MTEKEFPNNCTPTAAVIEQAIIDLVTQRGYTKTCCPSEVARKLAPQNWRCLMEQVRDVSKELKKKKQIDICQKGVIIQSDNWIGPIRLRLRQIKDTFKDNITKASDEIDKCYVGEREDLKTIEDKVKRRAATVTHAQKGTRKRKRVQHAENS